VAKRSIYYPFARIFHSSTSLGVLWNIGLSYSPFWFAKEDLLTDLLRSEIHSILELFAKHPDLREFFDLPEATPQQRAACFEALAHRALMDDDARLQDG